MIHGLVKRSLVFTLDALARYPMVSRVTFVECGGNSAPLFSNEPIQANVQALHGMVSCSEWTGVRLSTLLEETGIDPKAKWLIAEGADAPAVSRSVPMTKAMDDAMLALYQNGERLMPSNGYPMRLLLPGWEGNMNVKWLRRLKLTEAPAMSFYEARTYAPILPNGKAYQFFFLQEVKSFITHPSPGLTMKGLGFYEISGLAYSATGRISKVMVSARWRSELGASGAAGAGAEQGFDPLPHALELERRAGNFAKPCVGRGRQRAADPRSNRGRARPDQDSPVRHGLPDPALQRHHELGDRTQWGGQTCLCISLRTAP